jgi:23S rRNA (guanosine2251-2'-O)-methyltransferase
LRRSNRPTGRRSRRVTPDRDVIVGRSAVLELLRAGRRKVWRISVAEGARAAGTLAEILHLAREAQIPVEQIGRAELERGSGKHHGVAAEADPYPYVGLDDIREESERRGAPPFILMLDLLQDPQNAGTVLRTAEAVGVTGVVLPLSRAVGITPAVVSASAGASEHLLIAAENLATAIARLQEDGVTVIGLESGPTARPLESGSLAGPLALVVGSEGEGLRRLVRERCDALCRLSMRGRVGSMNAATAGSIALYLASADRTYPSDVARAGGVPAD